MTAVDQAAAGPTASTTPPGRSALRRLVSTDLTTFADEVWGRRALLSHAADLPRTELFDSAAVDELVSRRGLRTPFLRVAKDGSTLSDGAFTSSGGAGAGIGDQVSDDKLLRLFAGGATMVLQGLHRTWPPLIDFAQALSADLGHPVQVNAYVTPPQSRGFDDHYDVHDVFVLQVDGEKHWRVHEPVHDAPLRDQPWTDHRVAVETAAATEPVVDVVLRPGDCLYLPRGYLHAARALGGVSTHLTFGVHTWTRHDLADELARAALSTLADDPEVRRSLPLGVAVGEVADVTEVVELVRRRLTEAVEAVTTDMVTTSLADRARAGGRPAPVAPLAQLRTVQRLDDPGLRLRLRDHLSAAVHPVPDGTGTVRRGVLRSRAGDVPLSASEVPGVERLLRADKGYGDAVVGRSNDMGPRATVSDVLLDLDPDLVRRLVLAGVLVPA